MKKLVLSACAVAFVFGATDIKAEDTPAIVTEEQSCAQDGFYAGLGLGVNYTEVLLDEYENNYHDHNYGNHNKGSNPMLSVVLGYMWHVKERFHIGLEASVDLGKACAEHRENQISGGATRYFDTTTSINGITPFLGLKFGFVDCESKIMPYLTLGASYTAAKAKLTFWDQSGNYHGSDNQKVCKIAPTVKIGFTKPVRNNWMLSAEASWRASTNKSRDVLRPDYSGVNNQPCNSKLKNKDSFAFRLLMTHSFKFGR